MSTSLANKETVLTKIKKYRWVYVALLFGVLALAGAQLFHPQGFIFFPSAQDQILDFPSTALALDDSHWAISDRGDTRLSLVDAKGRILKQHEGRDRKLWYSGRLLGNFDSQEGLLYNLIPNLETGLPAQEEFYTLETDGTIGTVLLRLSYPDSLGADWEGQSNFAQVNNNKLVFFRKNAQQTWLMYSLALPPKPMEETELKSLSNTRDENEALIESRGSYTIQVLPPELDPYQMIGLCPGGAGTLYSLDAHGKIILWNLLDRSQETVFENSETSQSPRLLSPWRLTEGPMGSLLINDGKKNLWQFDVDTKSLKPLYGISLQNPGGAKENLALSRVNVSPSGQAVFINEYSGDLWSLNPDGSVRILKGISTGIQGQIKDVIACIFLYLALISLLVGSVLFYRTILHTMTRLAVKQIAILGPLLIVLTGFAAWFVLQDNQKLLEKEVEKRLLSLAQNAAAHLNPELSQNLNFAKMNLGDLQETEAYLELQELLVNIVNDNQDWWNTDLNCYVYLFQNSDWWIVGSYNYTELYPYPKESFTRSAETQSPEFVRYTDPYGEWLSALYPLPSEDSALALVEVTVNASVLDEGNQVYFQRIFITMVLILLLMVFVLGAFNYLLLHSVKLLTLGTSRIAEGDLEAQVDIHSRDEMEILGKHFNLMSFELRSSINRIVRINRMNEKFVPEPFLACLGKTSLEELSLGDNVELDMTILFMDIQDFTTISENLSPKETFDFINSYLAIMGPVIRKHGGFIDKYIGDAIMALFPLEPQKELIPPIPKVSDSAQSPQQVDPLPKNQNRAFQAVIELQEALESLNQERGTHGKPPINIGLGMNTGRLMLGIIGESERFEGTVLSDAVNLAARLESLTRYYQVKTLLTQETLESWPSEVQDQIRFIDKVRVKGKKAPSVLYELVYPSDKLAHVKLSSRHRYEEAFRLYTAADFEKAGFIFRDLALHCPEDGPVQLMAQRCFQYAEKPPKANWDGITEFNSK